MAMGVSGYPRPHYMPPIRGADKKEEESSNYKVWIEGAKSPFLLYRFLEEGDHKTLNRIADEDARIVSEWANQAIFLMVKKGSIEGIRYLSTLGARMDAVSAEGSTLLSEAIFAEQLDVMDYLLSMKAPLVLDEASGKNVFHLACECGSGRIISRLLEVMDAKEGFEYLNFDVISSEDLLRVLPAFFERRMTLPSSMDRFNQLLTAIISLDHEGLLGALYRQLVMEEATHTRSVQILPTQLLVHTYECFKCVFPARAYPVKMAALLVDLGIPIDSLAPNGLDTLYFRALSDVDRGLVDFCKLRGADLNYKIEFGEDKLEFPRLEFEIGHRRYETVMMMMQNGALFSKIGETDEDRLRFWEQMICDFFDQLKESAEEDNDILKKVVFKFIQFLKQIKIEIKSEGPIITILKKYWGQFYRPEGEGEEKFAETVDQIECLNEALIDLFSKGKSEPGDQLLLEEIIMELSKD